MASGEMTEDEWSPYEAFQNFFPPPAVGQRQMPGDARLALGAPIACCDHEAQRKWQSYCRDLQPVRPSTIYRPTLQARPISPLRKATHDFRVRLATTVSLQNKFE
jgi:hypothetical protein